MTKSGYQVATADNGFDALVKLKEVAIPDDDAIDKTFNTINDTLGKAKLATMVRE